MTDEEKMSKRAEKAALKEYPFSSTNVNNDVWDDNREPRDIYLKGYEQAEKDIILMVKRWIVDVYRVCDITDENGYRVDVRRLYRSLEEAIK